jgi:hypothetical protein
LSSHTFATVPYLTTTIRRLEAGLFTLFCLSLPLYFVYLYHSIFTFLRVFLVVVVVVVVVVAVVVVVVVVVVWSLQRTQSSTAVRPSSVTYHIVEVKTLPAKNSGSASCNESNISVEQQYSHSRQITIICRETPLNICSGPFGSPGTYARPHCLPRALFYQSRRNILWSSLSLIGYKLLRRILELQRTKQPH